MTIKQPHNAHKAHAIALEYDGDRPPFVSALAEGEQVAALLELAKQYRIPIQENEALIDALSALELGDAIPERVYLAVAQILAFVYHIRDQLPPQAQA